MSTVAADSFFSCMRSCAEVDAYYRIRKGTCRAAVEAGDIKSAQRSRSGRATFYVSPRDAERMWGAR